MHTTGQRIKDARVNKAMTQQELCQSLASLGQWADQSYISLLENNERKPSLDMVLALSAALGVSVEHLTEPLQAAYNGN